jgi:uncharacterized membrane protein
MLAILDISNGYRLLGYLHILAAIAAFGPMLVYPTLRDTAKLARLHMRITFPALTLVWVFGMGLVGTSKDVWEMSDGWIIGALVLWVVAMAVSWFLIRPALADRSDAADKRFHAGVGITHLVLVVTLYLMIFKPGN